MNAKRSASEKRGVTPLGILLLGMLVLVLTEVNEVQAATDTFTSSGTWTAPPGVTSVTVEAWGGGGAGGGAINDPAKGGGGAGGQYAKKVVTVVPGNNYAVVVGAGGAGGTGNGTAGGDSTFAINAVVAKGGAGGTGATSGVAGVGSAAGGVGDIVYAGGSGSAGAVGGGNCNNGGAGGGGAGSTGAGGSASGNTAGTGTATGGGDGGDGRNNSGNGNDGNVAGGGGGGACAESSTNRSGGDGAAGMMTITYAAAPVVTTDPATSLTTTGAMLNGTVDDNGASTTVTFEYGTTVGYGSTITATQSPLAAGTGSVGVSAQVYGLSCNATYHFRAKGVNSVGTANGGDQTFTTLACPSSSLFETASPGGCVDDNTGNIGTETWTTLDAVASDNSYATTSVNDPNNLQSHYLKCTNYGFAIPTGATINGITVNVERRASSTLIRDYAMRVVKGGTIGGTNRLNGTDYTTTDTVVAHGGAADLWGTTWTAAEINSTTFGAALAVYKIGTTGGSRTVYVDHMPITVNYTVPFPFVASINRNSPNPTAANTSVSWDVLFSASVTGVDASDFQLVPGGSTTGASITSVTGGGMVWTVTANTGTGATGTLRLNLVDNDSIVAGATPLGGAGVNNGNFTGEVYTLEIPVCNGSMIFCDDFERANPGAVGNGWTVTPGGDCTGQAGNTGCAGIDTDVPPFNATTNRANPTRSMFTRWTEVSVDSRAIDLSSVPSALVSFWLRRGGDSFSEYPEAVGEDYLVQYLDNTGTWKILAQYPTGVQEGEVFTPVIQLPPDALHANFKLRFYQPAGSGCCGQGGAPGVIGYDYWHIDNVIVTAAPESSYTGAFCDNFEAGLGRWSISAESAPPGSAIGVAGLGTTDYNSATHELDLRWGYVVASTLRTDMTGVTGNIEYWVKSGTTASRDPDAGEDLVVEYRNSSGNWIPLATYLGSDAANTVYNGSFVMPDDAKHAGFRLRFRMLNGSNFDNDYWHVDDVCVGTILPVADLSITKTRNGPMVPGTNVTYTLTVSNGGPDDLSGTIEVVDSLPSGLTYYSAGGTGWTCTSNAPDVTCSYVGTLDYGSSAQPITLIASVDAGASGMISNSATVDGTVTDNNTDNNTATNTANVLPGFVFTDGVCVHDKAFGAPGQTCKLITWAALTAGQDMPDIYITAKNVAGVPTPLSGASDKTINMEFGLSCINPVANADVKATFSASASALPLCEADGALPATWSSGVDLTFPAGVPSVGPYTFNYADVGQVELHMRNSAITSQAGSSGAFVVKPAGFTISNIIRTSDSFANPAASDASGNRFIAAGEAFTVTVKAVTSDGATATPNFGKETTPASVLLTRALVAPTVASGGLPGSLSNATISGTEFGSGGAVSDPNGSATVTNLSWNEVGIITLAGSMNGADYLGGGDVLNTYATPNIGRFTPAYFDVILTPGCGSFTYSGQPFLVTATALNAAGDTTKNYDSGCGFAKDVTISAPGNPDYFNGNVMAGASRFTHSNGITYPVSNSLTGPTPPITYTFPAKETTPLTPSTLPVPPATPLRATDTDAVSSYNHTEPQIDVRSGRVRLINAYGSELVSLSMPLRVEYYSADGWVTNAPDTCTSLGLPDLTLTNNVHTPPPGPGQGVATITIKTGSTSTVTPITPSVGVGSLDFTAPLAYGYADASMDLSTRTWLRYDWDGDATLDDPVGRATFGLYRGSPRHIYLRERF